jgi:glycerol-3-phosphate acyltransferase PlsX
VGNVEARDLLDGVADVVVTDGFTGNMVLKTVEGTALSMFKMLKTTLMSSLKSKLAAAVLKPEFKVLKNIGLFRVWWCGPIWLKGACN